MFRSRQLTDPELQIAYSEHERFQRLKTGKVAAALVAILMPAGVVLDWFVYPREIVPFAGIRLGCSILAGVIWFLLGTEFGIKFNRALNLSIPLLPALSIDLMVFLKEGPVSPYYAGLNLVLLAVSAVVRWNKLESFGVVGVVILTYLIACAAQHGPIGGATMGVFVNNIYFLILTGIIVVTGNHIFSRLRLSEFSLNYELEKSKKQLEESNQKLTELDQIKNRFFANISHELRTPLTLIISPLETILARYSQALDKDAVGLLHTMHGNGLRLLKLINDLLDLVRLDSGVMEARREPVPLGEFLQGMASAAKQMAEDKRIALIVAVAPEVGTAMLDRDKLEKIVINLQFNALKFTPAGGRIELRADKEGEELVLRVTDTGIGIPAKDLPNVFGRFFQVDSSARRKYQGVGIGLALVKELVELHDGTVKVESVEGQGTTFTARMPYIEAQPGEVAAPRVQPGQSLPAVASAAMTESSSSNGEPVPAVAGASGQEWLSNLYHRANLFGAATGDRSGPRKPVPAPGPNLHRFTALIADDQPDMLGFIGSELSPHYNTIQVSDGQQAVDKAAEHIPDIILLDMMMPEKDGIQACREIRAAAATRNVPIILITAHVDEETKLNALRAGASDFLPKPFSTTELHVRVKNLVASHNFQRELSEKNETLENTIDQLKETESQLVQTEKLASLGRLSAGIIHEINNPLNYAATGLYTLRSKAKLIPDADRDGYAEVLKDVEEGIQRVKSIVSDLRSFTHPGIQGVEEVNVQEAVASALKFLSQEWKNKVELRMNLSDGQVIWADKNKVIQVLINLFQNSLDAINAKTFDGEKPEIIITGRVQRDLSILTVRDNGEGIASEIMGKIFDPFFTTKDVGEGMGLGLSICYRIVKDFGGRIVVNSERGMFCEFSLEFPVNQPQEVLQP